MTKREQQRYRCALGIAVDALNTYANPEFYHAIAFMVDHPAGGFAADFDRRHGNDFYNRPMPGKAARRALHQLTKTYGDLSYLSRE